MLLRANKRVDYASLHGFRQLAPSDRNTVQSAVSDLGGRDSSMSQTADHAIHREARLLGAEELSPSAKGSPRTLKDSVIAKKAEIDRLESQLEMLALEQQLAELQHEAKQKQAVINGLQISQSQTQSHLATPSKSLLDTLLGPSQAAVQTPKATNMASYRAYLGLGDGYEDCNYYDIMQFIDDGPVGLGLSKGKAGLQKISAGNLTAEWESGLNEVFPVTWMGASIKILSRLIADRELDTEGTLQHLAYMLHITRLYKKNTWKSVILYDRKRRIMQAATKLQWDCEPNGVGSDTLISVPHKKMQGDMQPLHQTPLLIRKDHRKGLQEESDELCKLFNAGKCGFRPCKFRHCCNICGEPHPALRHPTAEDGMQIASGGTGFAFMHHGSPHTAATSGAMNPHPVPVWEQQHQQPKNM